MADEIKQKMGIECELIQGSGGVFDVKADGELIYSKHQTGRFPEHSEVIQALSARQPAGGRGKK